MKKFRTFGFAALIFLWAILSVALWFGPKSDYTYAERRKLAQMPAISVENILEGKFMPDFEDFTLDQFPLRDRFRQIKSLFHYYVLHQSDNNGIYLADDMVAKLEYPLNRSSVNYALGRLQYVYDTYLADSDCNIYAAMIPDKGYYLAENNGYPAMDYEALETAFCQGLSWAAYADIKDLLTADDYYRTDTHWRQERITAVAERLCARMGVQPAQNYKVCKAEQPFYGVYYGQAALPMEAEELYYLDSDLLDACTVTDLLTEDVTKVYDMDKADSPDLYEIFLSGAKALITVENPSGEPSRELVIFRDSFGSSLAPLLLQSYSKVTLVDIRYIQPDQLGKYLTFADQDVLFLYSTLILNSGRSLK